MKANQTKARELKTKSAEDLHKELISLTKAQFGLRMQVATQQMTNTSELRKVRRDIARVKTVLTEKGAQK
ncbi:MAG: 50S ribosomal protein L29 [Betaproteobacteria bacterium RBG_16_56_24]|nr:MAG: 50S ribosomal protein L29 [Betaproteobacteria bacterium RBG_16_56_24]